MPDGHSIRTRSTFVASPRPKCASSGCSLAWLSPPKIWRICHIVLPRIVASTRTFAPIAERLETVPATFLYHNNGNTNKWLTIKLAGTVSNRSAIGAKVRVEATIRGKTMWQMRQIFGGDSQANEQPLDAHFGLGDATNVDLVRIEWPSGIVQTMTNVAAKHFLTVVEHQENAAG